MNLEHREQRLTTHAGASEHKWTVELRLTCPDSSAHHVGTVRTNSGSGWTIVLEPSTVRTPAARAGRRAEHAASERVTCRQCGQLAGDNPPTIFATLDPGPDCHDHDPSPYVGEADPATRDTPRGASTLTFSTAPGDRTPTRLRWTCGHCAQQWQRTNRRGRQTAPDNVLKLTRLTSVLRLMREHGPSRLSVSLAPNGLTTLEERLRAREQASAQRPSL